jgi:hypothetical protein
MATRRAPAPGAASADAETAKVRVPSVDTEGVFTIGRATLLLLKKPAIRARLRVLPESELPSAVLDGYEAALVLAETSSAEYELARSGDTNARVSLVSVQTGLAMSRRMQRCLGYNLEGDDEVERQLADIREGSGHADLANDLAELSVLYGTHNEALRGDGRNYRASDAADSKALAEKIREEMAQGQRAVTKKAGQKWAKAFAALDASHGEIIAAGRYLDRKDSKLAARWVNLRAPAQRTSAKPAKTPKAAPGA